MSFAQTATTHACRCHRRADRSTRQWTWTLSGERSVWWREISREGDRKAGERRRRRSEEEFRTDDEAMKRLQVAANRRRSGKQMVNERDGQRMTCRILEHPAETPTCRRLRIVRVVTPDIGAHYVADSAAVQFTAPLHAMAWCSCWWRASLSFAGAVGYLLRHTHTHDMHVRTMVISTSALSTAAIHAGGDTSSRVEGPPWTLFPATGIVFPLQHRRTCCGAQMDPRSSCTARRN